MRDETDRLFRPRPQRQKLFVQVVAHDFVERAEGFVHQKDIGIEGQRPRDRGALLHPPRQLPGIFPPEPVKLNQLQHRLGPPIALRTVEAHDFKG